MKKWPTIIFAWVAVGAFLLIIARIMLPIMGLAGVEGELVQPLSRLMPASITLLVGAIALIVFEMRRQAKYAEVRPKRLVDEVEEWGEAFRGGEAPAARRSSQPAMAEVPRPASDAPAMPPPAPTYAAPPVIDADVEAIAPTAEETPEWRAAPRQGGRVTADLVEEPEAPAAEPIAGTAAGEEGEDGGERVRAVVNDELVARYRHLIDSAQASMASLNQLPPPPPEFAGREFELEEFLAEHNRNRTRVLGMQGLGGVGKTTLALKLADRLKDEYPDAQFYLDLKGASPQPLSVAEAQAHIIRAYLPTVRLPESDAELEHLYRSLLLDKRALLLLDNAVNTAQAQPLIAPGECLTIVTSRQPVQIPRMFARQLEGLPASEARDILLRLAPRVGALADRVAEICGYLPLALRLAACTLVLNPSLWPEEYVDRLTEVSRAGRFRHPVDVVVSLAYEFLSPSLQKLWRSLAVFSDTFDAGAAASIWTMNPAHAGSALDRLLAGSMIERNRASGRYRLHDLMAAFADARLSEEERTQASQRHAAHYQSVLHEADALYEQGGDLLKLGLDLVDLEWKNIQAGQVWAASHTARDRAACELCNSYPDAGKYVLDLRQHPRERIRWSEAALEAAQRMNRNKSSARHLIGLGDSYIALSEVHHAIEFYEQALKLAGVTRDRRAEAESLSGLGNAYYLGGVLGKAREEHERSLRLYTDLEDQRGIADALGNLGMTHYAVGEIRRAAELFEQQLASAREMGDRRNESNALGGLGLTQYVMGDSRAAAQLFNQQLAITREIGDRRGEAAALSNLGNACATLEYTPQAIAYHEQALTIAREMSDRRAEATALGGLGVAEYLAGDIPRSVELLEAQLKLTREIHDLRGEALALGNLGEARIVAGAPEAAIDPLRQAYQVAHQIGDLQAQANARFHLAIALDRTGDRPQAVREAENALELFRLADHPAAETVRKQLQAWLAA